MSIICIPLLIQSDGFKSVNIIAVREKYAIQVYSQKLFALYPVFCWFFIPNISTYSDGEEASKLSNFFEKLFTA